MEDYQIQCFTLLRDAVLQDSEKYPHINTLINHFQDKTPIYVARQFKKYVYGWNNRYLKNFGYKEAELILSQRHDLYTPSYLFYQDDAYKFLSRIVSPTTFPKYKAFY